MKRSRNGGLRFRCQKHCKRYSVADISELRKQLDQGTRSTRRYLPHRRADEHLQIITVMNFKGGSAKTTTAAHLAQWLALHGYRTLAIDLDPQASLSTLFGLQPELDVGPNETLYGAIRYDEEKRSIAEIVRATYIPDLHIIPGNIELQEFEYWTPRALMKREPGDTMFLREGRAGAWRSAKSLRRCGDRLPAAARPPDPLGADGRDIGAHHDSPAEARCHVHEPVFADETGDSTRAPLPRPAHRPATIGSNTSSPALSLATAAEPSDRVPAVDSRR